MEEKYKRLNEILNDYCNVIDNTFFLNNLDYYYELSYGVYRIMKECDSKLNDRNIEAAASISGIESLETVKNFIKEKIPHYESSFERYLKNGVFDFHDDTKCLYGSSAGELDNHRYIDINLHYKYTDPAVIMHEFMHQMNLEEGVYHHPRYTLTEAISIYYETLMFDYMESVGYDQKQVNMARRFRTIDCYETSIKLINYILLLDSYLSFGDLSDKTYEERNNYELTNWEDKEEYIRVINKVCDDLDKGNFVPPDELSRYILGTLIAYDAVTRNMNIKEFDQLNKHIKHDSVLNSLNKVGIDISDSDRLLYNFKNEVMRIDENLNKEDKKEK